MSPKSVWQLFSPTNCIGRVAKILENRKLKIDKQISLGTNLFSEIGPNGLNLAYEIQIK